MRSIALLALAASAVAIPLNHVVRDGGSLANVVAPVKAVADVVANVVAPVKVAAANVGIKNSNILDNIANNNDIKVLSPGRRGLVTVDAVIDALVQLLVKAGVNVQALIGNISVKDSSILTNILNRNNISALSGRGLLDVNALVKAVVNALVKAGVDVDAVLLNFNITKSQILSNDVNYNNIDLLRRGVPVVDVYALIKALLDACVKATGSIKVILANVSIKDSSILTNIANGNNIKIARDVQDGIIADVLLVLKALVQACLNAKIDVAAALLNIGLDCVNIADNIGNNNNISILSRGDASLVDVYATVLAIVDALVNLGANLDVAALNAFIQDSTIASDLANYNNIKVLSS